MKAKTGILIMGFILFCSFLMVGSDSYASMRSAEYGEGCSRDVFSPGYVNAALREARAIAEQNSPKDHGIWENILNMLAKKSAEKVAEEKAAETVKPELKKMVSTAEQQNAGPAKAPGEVEDKTKVKLPKELEGFLKDKGVLESLNYESLGLNDGDEVMYEYDAQKRIKTMKDRKGNELLAIDYAKNGSIGMMYDRKNQLAIEFATENTYTYYESYVKYVGGSVKYQYATTATTATGVLGKVLNIYMTTAKGKIMTGADVGGYMYFADKAPLVPWYSNALPYVGKYLYNDKIKVQEFRYNADGNLKSIRYNAWTAGLQAGYAMDGRYAYRIDTFNKCGKRTTAWFNDPAPSRFEPIFTGKVVKDKYNNYYITVKKAIDDKGKDVTDMYKGKTYLLTTRFTDTTATNYGGQPGVNRFVDQKLETAYSGGAAKFTALNWANLVGNSITVQGHLMTSSKSEVGLYLNGKKVGVFSAFSVL